MFRKLLSLALTGLLLHTASIQPTFAQSKAGNQAKLVEKVKAQILHLGVGETSCVAVRLRNNARMEGYISKTGEDSFEVTKLYQKACNLGGAHACLKIGKYRTGRLLKIENVSSINMGQNNSEKGRYNLTIQDGPDQYVAVYRMSYLQHDSSKDLVAGKDVEYRISGKNLFVKLPDGKEIKADLCLRTPQGLLICP